MKSDNLLSVVAESAVRQIVTRQMAYDAIRQAFESMANERAEVFPVAFARGFGEKEMFGVKSGADAANNNLGLKIGSYWAGNNARGLPAHGSTIVLLNAATGFPEALIGAAYLNGYRTAAANAIAVDYLARKDATILGVIGAGHQAEHEIRAIAEVRPLQHIKVFTRSAARSAWLAGRLQDMDVHIEFTTAENAVRGSDIVTTITPSTTPVVQAGWVDQGTHISAMGADAKGKHELDTALEAKSRLFADLPAQSVEIGEFQHAFTKGDITSADRIYPIGNVTQGISPGRNNAQEITIFDSSGIAIQDLAIARVVLDVATDRGLVTRVEL